MWDTAGQEAFAPIIKNYYKGVATGFLVVDSTDKDWKENMEKWGEINKTYAEKWPMINEKKEPPSDSKDWENVNNKFEKYFSKKPGK